MPSATIEPHLATMSMYDRQRDASGFDDNPYFIHPDPDQMLFDIEDVSYHMNDPSSSSYPWANAFPAPAPISDPDPKLQQSTGFGMQHYEYVNAQASPTDSFYDSPFYNTPDTSAGSPSAAFDSNLYLQWPSEVSPSSPIPIPASPITVEPQHSQSFVSFTDSSAHFPDQSTFSPTEFAALHPLPQSSPLSTSFEDRMARARVDSNSSSVQSMDLSDGPLTVPAWASQLFDGKNPVPSSSSMTMSPRRPSPLGGGGGGADSHSHSSSHSHRRHISIPTSGTTHSGRRGSIPSLYHSAGSPPFSPQSAPTSSMLRSYSRKAENFGSGGGGGGGGGGNSTLADDRDATVRRRRKISAPEQPEGTEKAAESPPLKPVLKPPKLAPSAWQLYFTDWIQRQQASNTRKLNVAQAAKEAGQEYANLSPEEKEPYKRRSQAMKDAREKELEAYMRTLTPEDIKRENAYRAAQRKAGKSRKSNIKDPNAPKKPLSAYFMFLQRIRADPLLVQEVFGEETETTKQSVLAAAKWRSMTDDERKPFLAQAEQEKMEYESARKLYEEGTVPFVSTLNFNIMPGSPAFSSMKVESESESEGLAADNSNRFSS